MNIKHCPEILPESEQISLDPDEQTDRGLLTRIAGRDTDALREFFLRHQMRIRNLLRRISRSLESVDDIVIDTFAVAWREAHAFGGESRASIWLLGIAYRLRVASLRGELSTSDGPIEDNCDGDLCGTSTGPDWLSQALIRLPFRQRTVVELVYGLGLSCDEIATVMQCSMETVKARLLHARRNLNLSRRSGVPLAR